MRNTCLALFHTSTGCSRFHINTLQQIAIANCVLSQMEHRLTVMRFLSHRMNQKKKSVGVSVGCVKIDNRMKWGKRKKVSSTSKSKNTKKITNDSKQPVRMKWKKKRTKEPPTTTTQSVQPTSSLVCEVWSIVCVFLLLLFVVNVRQALRTPRAHPMYVVIWMRWRIQFGKLCENSICRNLQRRANIKRGMEAVECIETEKRRRGERNLNVTGQNRDAIRRAIGEYKSLAWMHRNLNRIIETLRWTYT